MGAAESIPWEQRAIGCNEVAQLLGCKPRSVLDYYALQPGFPERIQARPARWIAGEIDEWRRLNRASTRVRRR